MTLELTAQQQQAIDRARAEPVSIVDPRTKAAYVMVPIEAYESVR